MEQPFHSFRAVPQKAITPQRIVGMIAAIGLQAGFVAALVWGLAGGFIQKLPEELKVAVEQEKVIPKPPPPPPPQLEQPPPPFVPPPDIIIQTEAPTNNAISTQSVQKPVTPTAAPVATRATVRGSRRSCDDLYPAISNRMGEHGVTQVKYTITAAGDVINASVSQSSGHDHLDEAALGCIVRFHFNPAKNAQGEAIETMTVTNIVWTIPK